MLLKTTDKQILEKLFQMGGGGVLDFSHNTMEEFFKDDLGVSIHDEKYNYASGSKANLLRGFCRVESDDCVANAIDALIQYIETKVVLGDLLKDNFPDNLITMGGNIAIRLRNGRAPSLQFETKEVNISKEEEFLKKEFEDVSIEKLGFNTVISGALEERLTEIEKNLNVKAPLSVIFISGSTLEGILYGVATNNIQKFNSAKATPKDKNGKTCNFNKWSLGNFIDVSRELGFLDEDVKKFSHVLRDFRNYIHPYHQVSQGFSPSEYTARICWQVLRLAIYQISKKK